MNKFNDKLLINYNYNNINNNYNIDNDIDILVKLINNPTIYNKDIYYLNKEFILYKPNNLPIILLYIIFIYYKLCINNIYLYYYYKDYLNNNYNYKIYFNYKNYLNDFYKHFSNIFLLENDFPHYNNNSIIIYTVDEYNKYITLYKNFYFKDFSRYILNFSNNLDLIKNPNNNLFIDTFYLDIYNYDDKNYHYIINDNLINLYENKTYLFVNIIDYINNKNNNLTNLEIFNNIIFLLFNMLPFDIIYYCGDNKDYNKYKQFMIEYYDKLDKDINLDDIDNFNFIFLYTIDNVEFNYLYTIKFFIYFIIFNKYIKNINNNYINKYNNNKEKNKKYHYKYSDCLIELILIIYNTVFVHKFYIIDDSNIKNIQYLNILFHLSNLALKYINTENKITTHLKFLYNDNNKVYIGTIFNDKMFKTHNNDYIFYNDDKIINEQNNDYNNFIINNNINNNIGINNYKNIKTLNYSYFISSDIQVNENNKKFNINNGVIEHDNDYYYYIHSI